MSEAGRVLGVMWSGRTWRAYGYLLVGLPLGVLWFTWAITLYATGAALVVLWVGIPILVFAQVSMRWIGALERVLMNALLHARIEAPEPAAPRPGAKDATSAWARTFFWGSSHFHDRHAWRVLAWTMARGVLGPVGFTLAIVALVVPWTLLAAAIFYTVVDAGGLTISWEESAPGVAPGWFGDWIYLLYPLSLVFAVPCAWMVRGFAAIHLPMARWSLGPCESEQVARATARAELAEERVRIDQELHDSIGHMITMTVVQAGAGAHVFDTNPEFARQALRNIEQRGRAAMGELDRIIAALRGDEPESRAPLPGIDDLPGLIEGSRAAGIAIDATLEPPPVAPAVGRAAFGIVREALTNAAKHAPGALVEVAVTKDGDALGIRVANTAGEGRGEAAIASGKRGIAGMRDRIALLGGVSRIGPVDGGFEVLALIPLGASLEPASGEPSPWSELRERVAPCEW